jgi:hypothetical protein
MLKLLGNIPIENPYYAIIHSADGIKIIPSHHIIRIEVFVEPNKITGKKLIGIEYTVINLDNQEELDYYYEYIAPIDNNTTEKDFEELMDYLTSLIILFKVSSSTIKFSLSSKENNNEKCILNIKETIKLHKKFNKKFKFLNEYLHPEQNQQSIDIEYTIELPEPDTITKEDIEKLSENEKELLLFALESELFNARHDNERYNKLLNIIQMLEESIEKDKLH